MVRTAFYKTKNFCYYQGKAWEEQPVSSCARACVIEDLTDKMEGREDSMKRIQAACICQTLHFQLKENTAHDYAVKLVQDEVHHYKEQMDRSRTKYKILEETQQPELHPIC